VSAWPVLSATSSTPEVGNWQRFLNEQGITDWAGAPLVCDESFGQRTSYATRMWQTKQGIAATAVVDASSRLRAVSLGFIPFIQAKNFQRFFPQKRPIRSIVIHTMEAPEKPATAENVARWFAGSTAPMASAHYSIGQLGVVQCVRDEDIAFHAPGANATGLGLEHEGYAKQTAEEWQDSTSRAALWHSARLAAKLCKRYGIPLVKLSSEDLRAGKPGLCGHVDVSHAFGGTHWDPGPAFPWDHYLHLVAAS
jgi:hypothetical protein